MKIIHRLFFGGDILFKDKRSKKVILVSHCILNQNSISDGTADFPGTFRVVVEKLVESDIGIIQMPCPELICLGLDRKDRKGSSRDVIVENTRIRNELLTDSSQKIIKRLIDDTVFQIENYIEHGFSIIGVIGVDRSPSCGVNTTSIDCKEVSSQGVFMEKLMSQLLDLNSDIEFIGLKTSFPEEALIRVEKLIDKKI